jgi:hypothetical protein
VDLPVEKSRDPKPEPMTRGAALVAAALAIVALGFPFGFLRAAIAVAMFAGILLFGVRYMRSIVIAPPEPEVADVSEYGLRYVCSMCGLELKVERAARDKPPTHCMEPMVLVREGGKPPLRPV